MKRLLLLVSISGCIQASPLLDMVIENKNLLDSQIKRIDAIASQMMDTGSGLYTTVIMQIDGYKKQIDENMTMLETVYRIFNDPFAGLESAVAENPTLSKALEIVRNPKFRLLYNAFWSAVLTPFAGASIPDFIKDVRTLVLEVKPLITSFQIAFEPIIKDFNARVNKKEFVKICKPKEYAADQPLTISVIADNRLCFSGVYSRENKGWAFDPQELYANLARAKNSFVKARIDLEKLEAFAKALGI